MYVGTGIDINGRGLLPVTIEVAQTDGLYHAAFGYRGAAESPYLMSGYDGKRQRNGQLCMIPFCD
jgi:hypothetical protein